MKDIRCIAIDDEPLALTVISSFCSRKGGISLTTYCEPSAGFEAIKKCRPDIVFLDIEMNGISGLEIAGHLTEGTVLIFTTAHANFAIDGYNLDAVDFLHKPFSYERFSRAVDKALRTIGPEEEDGTITVKQEYCNMVIRTEDITYIEAMENYTKIHTSDGKCTLSRTTMKNIQNMLPRKGFPRIHKSYILNSRYMLEYSRTAVRLKTGISLPVGRAYAEDFAKEFPVRKETRY